MMMKQTMNALLLTGVVAASASADTVAIRAEQIHVGNGTVLENGVVLVVDGKITAVGSGVSVPGDAEVIELENAHVTLGLIDANALIESADLVADEVVHGPNGVQLLFGHDCEVGCMCDGTMACALSSIHEDLAEGEVCPVCGGDHLGSAESEAEFIAGVRANASVTEGSSEVVPHTAMIDAVDLRSPDFARLAAEGVTTVFVSPDSAAVIGPRGAVVRTAGKIRQRILRETDAVQASMGSDTFRVGGGNRPPFGSFVTSRTRRPNSRMGVAWVFRKAFHDAAKVEAGLEAGGADTPPAAAMPVLSKIRSGKIPLRIQARANRDISTAFRLADEFDLSFTLLEATEAYTCLDELLERDMSVIYGPIYLDPSGVRRFSDEVRYTELATIRKLVDAGVPTALSAQDLREEDGLARQVMYAMRAGVSAEKALEMVTRIPAEMLGFGDELGTVEAGKRADLVVWNGTPFAATTQPTLVMIDGRVVVDRR